MRAVATLAWPEKSPSRETGQAANMTCQAPFLWAMGPAPALVLNALNSLNPGEPSTVGQGESEKLRRSLAGCGRGCPLFPLMILGGEQQCWCVLGAGQG